MTAGMHWRTETLWSMEVVPGTPFGTVWVEVEVPYIGDQRQPWRGNRYYPAMVRIDDEAGIPVHLADKLVDAVRIAQAGAEAFDALDTDASGLWA